MPVWCSRMCSGSDVDNCMCMPLFHAGLDTIFIHRTLPLANVVLQRWSLATLTVLLLMKTLDNDWFGS